MGTKAAADASRRMFEDEVVAISVTPFDDHGAVDVSARGRIIRRLLDGGVRYITPTGNTSEYYSLTDEEADDCIRHAVSESGGAARIIAGVGGDPVGAATAGQRAMAAGAFAVMIHSPSHPFVSSQGWVDYHAGIAARLDGAPVILYIRDPAVSPETVAALIESAGNIRAAKYAVANLPKVAAMLSSNAGNVEWVCGLAEGWAPFFALLGARSFTSGLVNVWPSVSTRLTRNLAEGYHVEAMRIWRAVHPFERLRELENGAFNVSIVKAALSDKGLCAAKVRPPISVVPDAMRTKYGEAFASLDSLD